MIRRPPRSTRYETLFPTRRSSDLEAQVELEDAVSPEERPVTATGQHLSAQPRALEVAARYRCGDASTVRHCADFLYAEDCDLQRHQQPGIHSSSPSLFGWMVASRNPRRLTFSADADSGFQLRLRTVMTIFPGCRSYSRDDPDADRGEDRGRRSRCRTSIIVNGQGTQVTSGSFLPPSGPNAIAR